MARSLGCCWAEIFGVGLKSDMVCALQDKSLRTRISKRQTCSPEDPSIPYPAPHWGALLYMRQSGLHTGAVWLVASSCSLQTTHNKAFGCRMGSKEEVLHASRLFIAVSCLSIKKLLSLCTLCSERRGSAWAPSSCLHSCWKEYFSPKDSYNLVCPNLPRRARIIRCLPDSALHPLVLSGLPSSSIPCPSVGLSPARTSTASVCPRVLPSSPISLRSFILVRTRTVVMMKISKTRAGITTESRGNSSDELWM